MEAKRTSMGDNPAIYCVECKTYTKHIEENTKVECSGCGLVYYKVNQWVAKDAHEQWPVNIQFDDPGQWREIPPSFSASSMALRAPTPVEVERLIGENLLLSGSRILRAEENNK